MTSNILFITNRWPFPARDGVTLPLTNYICGLVNAGYTADLLVIDQGVRDLGSREMQRGKFNTIGTISAQRIGGVRRIFDQVRGRRPYFSGWCIHDDPPKEMCYKEYDFVFSTPRAVVALASDLCTSEVIVAKQHIAAINDVAALAKKKACDTFDVHVGHVSSLVSYVTQRLKLIGLRRAEMNLLNETCDVVVVQSDIERTWIEHNGGRALASRVLQLSNGVDDTFFEIPLERKEKTIRFVGALEGIYRDRVAWFIKEIWPHVLRRHADCTLSVVGRCADARLTKFFSRHGVDHYTYIDSPIDLYASQSILIAPIFKGYGLINKVVQSMAAGTLVIGDATAFNAIPSFRRGIHGLIADDAHDFVEAIDRALSTTDMLFEIRREARALVAKNFSWQARIDGLLKSLPCRQHSHKMSIS